MKKLVFFFPWKEVSGGPFYLCRLANDLAKLSKYDIYYTDYYNGLSDNLLEDFRIRKLPYDGNWKKFQIFPDEPVILVTPIYWAHMVPHMHLDSKIVFFNWHNECIPVLQRDWYVSDLTIRNFLELVESTKSVFFCDKTHQLAQNRYSVTFDETFVPIVIPQRAERAKSELISNKDYNIAILGRLSTDKIYATLDLIDNICQLNLANTVNIHIIGEGVRQNLLFDKTFPENINIIRHGTMEISEVITLLSNEADILFAMGTSVLEGASIHLPSVILPHDIKPFHCNRYSFLYQAEGYALGWGPGQIRTLRISYYSIQQIFEMIYEKGAKREIGEKCFDYYLNNHTDNVQNFEYAIEENNLTYSQLQHFFKTLKNFNYYKGKVFLKVKETFGKVCKGFFILGFPLFLVTQTNEWHFNIYILLIPLFRINKYGKCFSIHILPLVWFYKFLLKLFEFIQKKSQRNKRLDTSEEDKPQKRGLLHQRIEQRLSRGEKIKICLFEARISCWQFGELYRLLENSGKFEPIVVVIPFLTMGHEAMINYMEETYEALQRGGYRVIKGYNKETGIFLDIKKELDPDAVFYSMFWEKHFQKNSYITQFEDIYSFLYPYGYDIVSHPDRESMNFKLQNKVTRYYLPTKIHKCIAEENMDNRAKNVYVTGSPKLDLMLDKNYVPADVWKYCVGDKKRIIWAPHHTLYERLPHAQLCAFLDLSDFMLELAKRYQDTVQFAFKPHPMLRPRLYDIWGRRRTDEYYQQWAQGDNTQLETGAFIDLFLTSDAMILDSISFIAEYTIINKPAFFTYGQQTRFPLNKFGKAIIELPYKNRTPATLFEDIIQFIDQVVLDGDDFKREARKKFVDAYMISPIGPTASQNIYDDVCRVILDDICLDYVVRWDEEEES